MWKIDKIDVLDNIQCLASKSFQERVWLNGVGPEITEFNESVLMYYSSIPKDEAEALGRLKTGFNEEEISVIIKFHRALNDFIEKNGWDIPIEEMMKNKDWLNVREEAKKVCKYFKVEPLA